jgi:hypothetical protein
VECWNGRWVGKLISGKMERNKDREISKTSATDSNKRRRRKIRKV